MCWEDEQIARRKGSAEQRVTVGTTAVPIVPISKTRVGIVFLGASAGTISVSTRSDVTAGQGLNITNTNGPFEIANYVYGDATKKAWYAIADAANRVLSWIEVTLPEERNPNA